MSPDKGDVFEKMESKNADKMPKREHLPTGKPAWETETWSLEPRKRRGYVLSEEDGGCVLSFFP